MDRAHVSVYTHKQSILGMGRPIISRSHTYRVLIVRRAPNSDRPFTFLLKYVPRSAVRPRHVPRLAPKRSASLSRIVQQLAPPTKELYVASIILNDQPATFSVAAMLSCCLANHLVLLIALPCQLPCQLPCLALPCLALPCLALPCLVKLPCLALLCLACDI